MPRSLTDLAGLNVSAEDFLAAVLDTVAQPVWVVDRDDVIRFANPAALAALGYDEADDLSGHSRHATIHSRHKDGTPFPADECPLLRPLVTGDTVTSELDWFVRRDGSIFAVSYVSVPLETPEGRGAIVTFNDIEDRLRAERELHERELALAAQQSSLRQVAALVAGGAASAEVFGAIAREVAHLLGLSLVAVWRYEPDDTVTVLGAWSDRPHPLQPGTRWPLDGPALVTLVKETSRPARVEDFGQVAGAIGAAVREIGIRSGAGAPIVVDGQLWGAMATYRSDPEPLPRQIEDRLAEFTGLIAAAFSNTASRDELARLADEQAALRRVATLVARGVPPPEVFAAVAREVGLLFGVDATHMARYELDGTATGVAGWSPSGGHKPVGTRVNTEGESIVGIVLRTGRAARVHNYENVSGAAAALGRELGLRSSVGAPIVVDQRLWGVMIVSTKDDRPLPADTESRIAAFTELVATAISNTEARIEVGRLAEEQAALRRVATLVARETAPDAVFAAVVREVGEVLGVDATHLGRFDGDGTVVSVAQWGSYPSVPIGARFRLEGDSVSARVLRTGRPARMDSYEDAPGVIAATLRQAGIRVSIGVPILVEGRTWGVMTATSKGAEPFPAETALRLQLFTGFVATAISNATAHDKVRVLADEQAALRRVATLVAQGPHPSAVFDAVTREVAELLEASAVSLARRDDDMLRVIATTEPAADLRVGDRFPLGGTNVTSIVLRTGRTSRIDDFAEATGQIGDVARQAGVRSAVAAPVVVDGRTWGVLAAIWTDRGPPPDDTEERMASFAELLDTAIANADSRDQLTASRARVLAAGDEARRRFVRDLHDGAQQRLVHTTVTLKLAQHALPENPSQAEAHVAEALSVAERATAEVRELSHGILPSVLTRGGLRAGVRAFVSRLDLPVDVDVLSERLPPDIEASAYFIVAEALTNVVKHARAMRATVWAALDDGVLTLEVRDDGVGGANPEGHGLVGIADRVDAIGGRLRIDSTDGDGTVLTARLPVSTRWPREPEDP